MHNPQYRVAIAWQNSAYNQPPYPDYYLGTGMSTPPQPNIYTAGASAAPVAKKLDFNNDSNTLNIRPNPVDNASYLDYNSNSTRLVLVISVSNGHIVFRRSGSVTELNNGLNAVISTFKTGIYMVQLRDGENVLKGKMVKQ